MKGECTRVLLVENNEADARTYERILTEKSEKKFEIDTAGRLEEARQNMHEGCPFDIVLLDLGLPDSRGVNTVEGIQEVNPEIPIVVLTGLDYEEIAEQSLEKGVQDYLVKDEITPPLLSRSIDYAIRRARTQKELKRSERRFRELAENIQEVFWMIDADAERFLYVSPAFENIWGRSGEELVEDSEIFFETIHEEDLETVRDSHPVVTGEPGELEYRIVLPEGGTRWIRDRSFRVGGNADEEHRIAGLAEDATEQKTRRRNLEETLVFKDTLLTEVHHRVRNNLELVNRLLNLKVQSLDDPEIKDTLTTLKDRIESMTLIHEKLSGISHQQRVDLYEFINSLLTELQGLREPPASIQTRLEMKPVQMNVDTALSCGVVVMELVSNAYEHAFPDGTGLVEILFQEIDEEHYELVVRDDGTGLEGDGGDGGANKLGLQLIRKIVEDQMKGQMEISTNGGTTVRIQFSPDQTVPEAA